MKGATLRAALAVAALSLAPSAGRATVYDAYQGFIQLGQPGDPFSFGYRTSTSSFLAFDSVTSTCFGVSGIVCAYSAAFNTSNLPAAGVNLTGAPATAGTAYLPTGVLIVHPVGPGAPAPVNGAQGDVVVRFTAPAAGIYTVDGLAGLLDQQPTGVIVSAEAPSGSISTPLSGPQGTLLPFNLSATLAAGDRVDFVVASGTSYSGDATGLRLSISVPEPGTAATLMAALLFAGMLRRPRRRTLTTS